MAIEVKSKDFLRFLFYETSKSYLSFSLSACLSVGVVQVYTPDTMVETKKMAETVAINIIGRGKGVKEQHESCSWEVSQIIVPWNVA